MALAVEHCELGGLFSFERNNKMEHKQIKSLEELIAFLKSCPLEYEITSFQQGKAVVKFWIGSNNE